ncbi:hypothetical protein DBV39_09870 [Orrella marina]|uniref:Uncharacterized protein n=1 Tax=Orrella marina TaxID=2163011 RepID=A0A2R4XJE3_9BURK|nr:hypothetical protein DBV39_09870 [Orrella marina]
MICPFMGYKTKGKKSGPYVVQEGAHSLTLDWSDAPRATGRLRAVLSILEMDFCGQLSMCSPFAHSKGVSADVIDWTLLKA